MLAKELIFISMAKLNKLDMLHGEVSLNILDLVIISVRKMTLKKLTIKRTLKLKAKAAQANRLVAFTSELAEEHRSKDGQLGEDRFKCMWYLDQLCHAIWHGSTISRLPIFPSGCGIHQTFCTTMCNVVIR